MRLKLLLLCLLLCIQPIQAKSSENYLVISNDMPFSILASLEENKHATMHILPDQLILPDNQSASQVKYQKKSQNFAKQIETVFHISVDHIVELNLKNISKNMNVPYTEENVSSFSSLCDYFKQVKNHVRIKDVLHFKEYIDSDMGINNYYDLYKYFKNADVTFDYGYINYIIGEDFYLPLDLTFHKKT